jgi:lipoate-protein ligase A
MDADARLLAELDPDGPPLLHLYRWQGACATMGHFVKPEEWLQLEAVRRHGLDLGRRPTGGGILFHLTDLAFSFFLPSGHPLFSMNTLTNYQTVNRWVVRVIQRYLGELCGGELLPSEPQAATTAAQHFCMAKPTKYDVMWHGRKVGGAAQRRRKQGLLHQGSISLAPAPTELLKDVLRPEQGVFAAMQQHTHCLLEGPVSSEKMEQVRQELEAFLEEEVRAACEASVCQSHT